MTFTNFDTHALRRERFLKMIGYIVDWARERGFQEGATAKMQQVKGEEEAGELIGHLMESFSNGAIDQDLIEDDIGDNIVVMVIQAYQGCLFPEDLFQYREDRNHVGDDLGEVVLHYIASRGKLAGDLCRDRDFDVNLVNCFEKLYDVVDALEFDILACMQTAWDGIKDRKGQWVNGTFVKEEDLA